MTDASCCRSSRFHEGFYSFQDERTTLRKKSDLLVRATTREICIRVRFLLPPSFSLPFAGVFALGLVFVKYTKVRRLLKRQQLLGNSKILHGEEGRQQTRASLS